MRGSTLLCGFYALLLTGAAALPLAAETAHETHSKHVSPYAGEETRRIKSLSSKDIDELRNGRGWGLAKVAELNGMPGPSHLLDMREEIGLTPQQVADIEALFRRMKASAMALGERLILLETDLNDAFARGDIDRAALEAKLDVIGKVRADLRLVHLETHLATPKILQPEQIAAYNRLRGYGAGDPCASVPSGHDPAMWRRHNGC
jgi:Spy/CpxP family protein refolding chaperone